MATKPHDAGHYVALMPNPVIAPIQGTPTYESIRRVNDALSANAAAVYNRRASDNLGYLAVTETAGVYNTLASARYTDPPQPDDTCPTTPGNNPTAAQVAATRRSWEETKEAYREHHVVAAILRRQLLAAVDPIYVAELKRDYTGFNAVAPLDILTHLYDTYAKIGPKELDANDKRMAAPWDPSQPFENLVLQIQRGVAFAAHGKEAITPERAVRVAYTIVSRTNAFAEDCRRWRESTKTKDWAAFKAHFRAAHLQWRLSAEEAAAPTAFAASAGPICPAIDPGSHPIPADTRAPLTDLHAETADAIANLAVATRADRDAITSLTATVSALRHDLRAKDDLIAKLRSDLADARRRRRRGGAPRDRRGGEQPSTADAQPSANSATRTVAPAPAPTASASGSDAAAPYYPPGHYCWTHGYRCLHSSAKCPSPLPGHCPLATKREPMGGSTANFCL